MTSRKETFMNEPYKVIYSVVDQFCVVWVRFLAITANLISQFERKIKNVNRQNVDRTQFEAKEYLFLYKESLN